MVHRRVPITFLIRISIVTIRGRPNHSHACIPFFTSSLHGNRHEQLKANWSKNQTFLVSFLFRFVSSSSYLDTVPSMHTNTLLPLEHTFLSFPLSLLKPTLYYVLTPKSSWMLMLDTMLNFNPYLSSNSVGCYLSGVLLMGSVLSGLWNSAVVRARRSVSPGLPLSLTNTIFPIYHRYLYALNEPCSGWIPVSLKVDFWTTGPVMFSSCRAAVCAIARW